MRRVLLLIGVVLVQATAALDQPGGIDPPSATEPPAVAHISPDPSVTPSVHAEREGDVWSVWQGGMFLWRGKGPVDRGSDVAPAGMRQDSLSLIASWECPGNIHSGGQLHVWDLDGDGVLDLQLLQLRLRHLAA